MSARGTDARTPRGARGAGTFIPRAPHGRSTTDGLKFTAYGGAFTYARSPLVRVLGGSVAAGFGALVAAYAILGRDVVGAVGGATFLVFGSLIIATACLMATRRARRGEARPWTSRPGFRRW